MKFFWHALVTGSLAVPVNGIIGKPSYMAVRIADCRGSIVHAAQITQGFVIELGNGVNPL